MARDRSRPPPLVLPSDRSITLQPARPGMARKAKRSRRAPAAKPHRPRARSSRVPAVVPPPPDSPSLDQILRDSLDLARIDRGAPLEAEGVEEDGELTAPAKERPPEVRVVSVGSFVPTGHLVCEGCGRILRWTIPEGPRKELAEVAITSPEGWDVRSLAVSFTGLCPTCRRASAAER